MITSTIESNVLQLHYYLEENSHSMDAMILNKAEGEILKIINEISKILDVDVQIETQALEEGGIKAVYKFLTKKKYRKNVNLIAGFVAGISASVIASVVTDQLTKDPELEQLQKQEMRLNILKLKKELKESEDAEKTEKDAENVEDKEIPKLISAENIESISDYISENNKIKIYKSNFYSIAKDEEKLVKISTQILNNNQEPISKEKFVLKREFNNLIIKNTNMEDEYFQSIAIEIVAPVLRGNSLKWKGIFNGENITFSLKDKKFKDLIEAKNLKFTNGTKLICDLEINRKMNPDGEIIVGNKNVYDITAIHYPDGDKVDIL